MKVFTPDELASVAGDKYMGVLVASKYARELNSLPLDRSPYGKNKLTTMALEALVSGELDYRVVSKKRVDRD